MKEKHINKGFVFDLDDTLITTEATVLVRDVKTGEKLRTLTPNQYNRYKKGEDEVYDFEEFFDERLIRAAIPYKKWPLMKRIDEEISYEERPSDLYILTARTYHVQESIHGLFKSWGIMNLSLDNVICMGDPNGEFNIADKKRSILKNIAKSHDRVWFFDDDEKNVKVAEGIENIKTKLV